MTLQPFEPGQAYVFNGLEIPSQQTLAPATAPTLAFRPSCRQLTAVVQAPTQGFPNGSVAYGIQNPNAQQLIILRELPTGLDQTESFFTLDTDGICKLNGVDVPVVFSDMLPKPVQAEVQANQGESQTVATAEPSLDPTLVFGVSVLLAGLAYGAFTLWKRPRTLPADVSKPSPIQELVNLTQQAESSQAGANNDE